MTEQTPAGQPSARRRPRALVVVFALAVVAAPLAATAAIRTDYSSAPPLVRAEGHSRAAPGGASRLEKPQAGVAKRAHLSKPARLGKPKVLYLKKARSVVFDVRKLRSVVVKRERAEDGGPARDADADAANTDADAANTDADAADTDADAANTDAAKRGAAPATAETSTQSPAAPAPAPDSSFDGLDFATWGAGHPPDTNGDVGPTYYIQTINTSIGIYDKSTGNRVAAFTFNAFMSQGHFGNLCDTDNFGDPVVLYDSFEDRWFITDFAFKLDGSRQRQPADRLPVLRRLEDRRPGQRRLELLLDRRRRAASATTRSSASGRTASTCRPTCSATPSGASYIALHVWALNKQQMYAGAPSAAGGRLRRRPSATSRSSRRTRGSRPARRRRARPSTSSRPSSS